MDWKFVLAAVVFFGAVLAGSTCTVREGGVIEWRGRIDTSDLRDQVEEFIEDFE